MVPQLAVASQPGASTSAVTKLDIADKGESSTGALILPVNHRGGEEDEGGEEVVGVSFTYNHAALT